MKFATHTALFVVRGGLTTEWSADMLSFRNHPDLDRSELPFMRVSRKGSKGNDRSSRSREQYESKDAREGRFWELGEFVPPV